MANLDTRSKRASSLGIGLAFLLAPVLPDSTLDQGDRQHGTWSYSGIAASAPSTPSVNHPLVEMWMGDTEPDSSLGNLLYVNTSTGVTKVRGDAGSSMVTLVSNPTAGNLIDVSGTQVAVDLTEAAAFSGAVDPLADKVVVTDVSAATPTERLIPVVDLHPFVLDREETNVAVTNTTTRTDIWMKPIAANTMGTDREIRVSLRGTYKNDSGVAANLTWYVKYGTTEFIEVALNNIADSADLRAWSMVLRFMGDGATNKQHACLDGIMSDADTAVVGTGSFSGTGFVCAVVNSITAEDSTQAVNLAVSVAHSAADANISLECQQVVAELLGGTT